MRRFLYKNYKTDATKKKRTRAGLIGYLNKLIKLDVAGIYKDFKNEKLLELLRFKEIIEDKLNSIIRLSEEIQGALDDNAFQAEFEK